MKIFFFCVFCLNFFFFVIYGAVLQAVQNGLKKINNLTIHLLRWPNLFTRVTKKVEKHIFGEQAVIYNVFQASSSLYALRLLPNR